MIHRLTYPNLSPHTQSHTHTNTNHQTINKATHTQTIKPVGANNGHHTHHPSHRSANPSHQSETHVVNLKPKPPIKKNITGANLFKKKIITGANPLKKNHHGATRANPLKKNHLRSHHRSYWWSTQPIHPSINRSTVSNPPINRSKPTINRSQLTDPNPARRSTLIQPPKSKTQGMAMKLQRWESRWRNREGRERREQQ